MHLYPLFVMRKVCQQNPIIARQHNKKRRKNLKKNIKYYEAEDMPQALSQVFLERQIQNEATYL